MENTNPQHAEDPNKPHKPIEHDYEAHKRDPGPAPQAVKEDNDKGAGPALKWIIPIVVIILFIIYFFVF